MSEEMKNSHEEETEKTVDGTEEQQMAEPEETVRGEGETETAEAEASREEELAARISELEAQLAEKENKYLRLYADFDNFRRRAQLEREAGEKYKSQQLITNLLPAIDNFERAMQIETDNDQAKALLDGVAMVYRSIISALEQEGAEQIEAAGKEFDPNFHQAVMQADDPEFGPNIVVEELQKGYKLKDRVLRPSMVKVNK